MATVCALLKSCSINVAYPLYQEARSTRCTWRRAGLRAGCLWTFKNSKVLGRQTAASAREQPWRSGAWRRPARAIVAQRSAAVARKALSARGRVQNPGPLQQPAGLWPRGLQGREDSPKAQWEPNRPAQAHQPNVYLEPKWLRCHLRHSAQVSM